MAKLAGAKHIISIELTPLFLYNDAPNTSEDYNIVSILSTSFDAAMTGSLQRNLSYIGVANEGSLEDSKTNIYRIAPLVPESVKVCIDSECQNNQEEFHEKSQEIKVSPGIIAFDGLYNDRHQLVMNLYDWFIQGYIDAMGYSEEQDIKDIAKNDVLIREYLTYGPSRGCTMNYILSGNKFWYMERRPIPERADYIKDGVRIPPSSALAARAIRIEQERIKDSNSEFADRALCPKEPIKLQTSNGQT